MKLFNKRPLCLILCIALGGFSLSVALTNVWRIILGSLSLGILVLLFIFKHLLSGRVVLARICCIVLTVAVLLGGLMSFVFFPTEFDGDEVDVQGFVTSADHTDLSTSVIILNTEQINGSRDRHTIYIRGDKDSLSGINIGDEISIRIKLTSLSQSGGNPQNTYYIGRGYSATAVPSSAAEIQSRDNFTVYYYFDRIRESVADRFRIISDKETGDFLAALLTGERGVLDGETTLNFTRTGTTHILALSGAHLVILAYALTLLLKVFRVNKKLRTVIIAVFVFLYMLLTGMSACVTRAGVMLIITSAIYLLSHKSDGVTSLAISVTLIVIFQPYAIFDLSLWLSAFATLGLLYLSELTPQRGEKPRLVKRILRALYIATLASVFAITASVIFTLFTFDSFSPMAVIATLVLSPLTEAIIYLGMIGLAIGTFIPIGVPITILTEFTKDVTAVMAAPKLALIPLDIPFLRPMGIILVVVFFGFVLFGDVKHPKKAILTVCAFFLAFNLCGIIGYTVIRADDAVVYKADTASNLIAVRSDGEVGVIVSGGKKYTDYYAVNLLDEMNSCEIDFYVITSYSAYTYEQILTTVSSVKTDTVFIPKPETSNELVQAEMIAALLSNSRTDMQFYEKDESIAIGEYSYTLVWHSNIDSSVLRDAFLLNNDKNSIAYLSAECLDFFNTHVSAVINAADTVIIGGDNGAKYREVTLSPRVARTVYFGSAYSISEGMQEFINRTGTVVRYTDEYENIE